MAKFIITGGPCTGKTTLIESLTKEGYKTITESAREVIEEENGKSNGIFPWTDLYEFQKKVIAKQKNKEQHIKQKENIFLDRSLVDNIAYCELGNVNLDTTILKDIQNANYERVFILARLPFYQTDNSRKEQTVEAERIHNKIYDVYNRLGFDIINVPFLPPEERKEYITKRIPSKEGKYELEGKFPVNNLDAIRETIKKFSLVSKGTSQEYNTIHDLFSIFHNLGYTFRLRDNGNYIATFKGLDKGNNYTKRLELEKIISKNLYSILNTVLPKVTSYSKVREEYTPVGDSTCTIALDDVSGKGYFVEIEASTENQINLWKDRLGILNSAVRTPYFKMPNKIQI